MDSVRRGIDEDIYLSQQAKAILKRDYLSIDESIAVKRFKSEACADFQFSFGTCKICDDKASGIHYGVSTCEGCKGFFKRSLDKKESYTCPANNLCVINKESRNRCKMCRYKKCIEMGMSVDGIKMGRIPKSEKLKSIIDLQNKEKILNQNLNGIVSLKNSTSGDKFYLSNEFKIWLTNQLENIRDSNNNVIYQILESYDGLNLLNMINEFQLFSPSRASTNQIVSSELELVQITLLRDRAYQIYKKHIVKSFLINNSKERLRTGNFIGPNVENVTHEEIIGAAASIITSHYKWMKKYAKELPGLNRFSHEDFDLMISKTLVFTAALMVNEFVKNDESYLISPTGYQLSRRRKLKSFGEKSTQLSFLIHSKFNKLNFSEKECSIFYPFCMFNCNANYITNKEIFVQLKMTYTKMLIYEFQLNGRDRESLKTFNEIIELISVISKTTEIVDEN